MGAYLRGRWWWYKRILEGRLYQKPLKIRKGQESMLSARIAQEDARIVALHYGLGVPSGGKAIALSKFIPRYLEAKRDKKTIDRDRQRLEYIASLLPDLPLNFYTKAHFEGLEKKLAEAGPLGRPSKPATVNRYMELLRALFNLAIEDGELKENPLRFYHPFAEEGTRRALTEDEVRAILAAARKLETLKIFRIRHVFYDLLLFGLATGMRLSEILNLRRSWISEDLVAIPFSSTKSRRRGVGVSKQEAKLVTLNAAALEVIGRQPVTDEYVFALHRRDAMAVQHGVEGIRRLTGIKDFTFHHLRHTVSTLVASQSSLATARAVLGHSDLKTTLRYTHPSLADQRKTVTILDTYILRVTRK